MKQKIIIAAGGTGGHLLPAQQLALCLQDKAELLFVGHRLGESAFFRQQEFVYRPIDAAPWRLSAYGLARFAWVSCASTFKAVRLLRKFQPDCIVGFGSYHTFPVLAAAALLRKKIALFEANCLLGKVNRLFSPFASCVAAQFALPGQSQLVPLLPWSGQIAAVGKKEARLHYGLDPERTTVLIFGGSQGAAFLNRQVPRALPQGVQAIHLIGKGHRVEDIEQLYKEAGIFACVKAYEERMSLAYEAADVAICRSGASTIAELIGFRLPALLIPYPYSTEGHQIANAEFLAKKIGGATMRLESADALPEAIVELFEHAQEYRQALDRIRRECEGRKSFASMILGES